MTVLGGRGMGGGSTVMFGFIFYGANSFYGDWRKGGILLEEWGGLWKS